MGLLLRRLLLSLLLACTGTLAAAQTASEAPAPTVQELRKRLDQQPAQASDEEETRRQLATLQTIAIEAERIAGARSTALLDLDVRLAGLGPAPDKGQPPEAHGVSSQRSQLVRERERIDTELKLARLIALDAGQRATKLSQQRRAQFQAAISTRSASPLTAEFWRRIARNADDDRTRALQLLTTLGTAAAAAQAAGAPAWWGTVTAALLLAFALPWGARRLLLRLLPPHLPTSRLRRTLLAAASVALHTLCVGIAADMLWNGLRAAGSLPEALQPLQLASVRAAVFTTFAVTLSHALLSPRHASWRLLQLPDGLARRISPFTSALALWSALSTFSSEFNSAIGASLWAEVLAQTLYALLIAATVTLALWRLRRWRVRHAAQAEEEDAQTSPWLALALAFTRLVVLAIVGATALGYVALAGVLARELVWIAVVLASAHLLALLLDDLSHALLSSHGALGAPLRSALALDARRLDQLAVLFAAALRVAVFIYMLLALVAPLGTRPEDVLVRGSHLQQNLEIGSLSLTPHHLLVALALLAAGLAAVRVFKRWLEQRFLPHTALEESMHNPIVTLLGYAGTAAVLVVALASLGISVERMALVGSALSVGIGFGLKAIVENFVSGLILLAERPIKVGDWVALGDTEGDVRRINVRSTEIQLWDRSTVIVPNSELISKAVRNVTPAGALGRVVLRVPAPLDTDADRLRALLLQTLQQHEAVLETPAPAVTLEGIQGASLMFVAVGYVESPRRVSAVRSELLFTLLAALRAAGIALSSPQTIALSHSGVAPAAASAPPQAQP